MKKRLKEYICDITENKNSLSLGLFENEELIGVALGRIKHWFDKAEYCIDDLCIKTSKQHCGAGSVMINEIKSYCKNNEITVISLKTSKKAKAYNFYLKNGFEEKKDDVFFETEC